jgi:RND family efflux transporter MFP subunit
MKAMRRLTAIIAFGLVLGGISACGGGGQAPPDRPREPIDVTVVPAAVADTAERLEAGGIVAARETAAMSSRITATIASVRVKAGDRVRAGDVLATLDARDTVEHTQQVRASAVAAEKSLAQARTEQSAAEAEHRLATAWHKRIAALHARDSATEQERDEAEARLTAAAARVAGALAAIETADANLVAMRSALAAAAAAESYTAIRAPFDGLVTERLVDPGNLAAPGVPLVRIDADGARQILVRVDEARASYVHPGDVVDVAVEEPGEGGPVETRFDGVVAEVARAIGADQRAFTVKVTIPATVTARSGSFARVILRGQRRRALLIPAAAIRRQGQVSSVYVVQDGVARLRLIHTGASSAAGVEVLAGLDAGESIVTAPIDRLSDGIRVAVAAAGQRSGGQR